MVDFTRYSGFEGLKVDVGRKVETKLGSNLDGLQVYGKHGSELAARPPRPRELDGATVGPELRGSQRPVNEKSISGAKQSTNQLCKKRKDSLPVSVVAMSTDFYFIAQLSWRVFSM